MEIEPKNQSRNFRSETFVCSDFLAEWKTAFKDRLKTKQLQSIELINYLSFYRSSNREMFY